MNRIQSNKMRKPLFNLILSSIFLALGLILPFVTGQLPAVNQILLPMHLPVFLCGLILGWQYGLCIGAVLPILRSAFFGFPVFFPTAIGMAFELACYGFFSGLIYFKCKKQNLASLYLSLGISMLLGRVVRCAVEICLLGLGDNGFKFGAFMLGTVIKSLPGVLLQLILIPLILFALKRARVVKDSSKSF